ncbi:MAG: hypothetical protein BAA01_01950 [Bacillus thermozeamaize]|jgi:hypothetical protein|uniref:Uncharacterized protein n=1 Tax=Bacillus thermozeamaize TaxID=230954 RepID=A0A1Y3PJ05_9BACI|nr:MAG: hypothetical protein BAA01_01950 [Bacillus thermozeamaize]
MDGKTKVRLGVGLAGLLTFAGSFALISSSDETGMPTSQTPDFFQVPFPDLEPYEPSPSLAPSLDPEDEEDEFSPKFMLRQVGWVPQTNTRAS